MAIDRGSMARTLIKNGTLITSQSIYEADIVVEGETIIGIASSAEANPDDRVIDASNMLVLPGIVDPHTHIQLDTGIYKTADNWEIGTKAAAAGGVTTVVDFATQYPGQTVDEALENRLNEASVALIDYSFHCMITDLPYGNEEAMLGRLVERGVPGFKVYTTYRPNYYMDDFTLTRLMSAAKAVNGIVMVHAENDAIVSAATDQLVSEGKTGWRFHAKGRPPLAEQEAIHRVAFLSKTTGAVLYVVHCTTWESISIIQEARSHGAPVYCETCPQYLLLNDSVYDGPYPEHFILQPPLRNWAYYPDGRSDLWHWLEPSGNDGESAIDVISTDSCDYTLSQKVEFKEFTRTPGGLPGLETLLPLVYTYGVLDSRIRFGLIDLVKKLCENPARIFGLFPRKGILQVGSDADIVLYDPRTQHEIHYEDLHYLAGYSPFEGLTVRGKICLTMSRGEVIYENNQFKGTVGRGQFLKASPIMHT
jgi:dihydropyrimidinase